MAGVTKASRVATLLHIEDDLAWVESIGQIIRSWPEVSYLDGASTGAQGVALCRAGQPDLVLLDLNLPDGDGFDVAAQLLALPRPPRILLLTVRLDEAALHHADRLGVAGVLWKAKSVRGVLRQALAEVLAGRRFFAPEVQAARRVWHSQPEAFFKILSARQIELLPGFARGDSHAQIAAQTGLSQSTVQWHRYDIMAKLDLHSTVDLMRWAREKGFDDHLRPAPPCVTAD